jgi:endonuclease YncB( thermonuclease family)
MALMKMVLRCVLVAILLLTPLTSTNAASAQALQVYDGDTFKILMEGKKVRLRLYGIDAPESGQKGNVSAARFLKRSVFGNLLEIVVLEVDWTGQIQAIVTNVDNGLCVNAAMVANGYSWVDPQKCNTKECAHWKKLESNARRFKLGIWSGYNLVPPWEFRREGD